MDTSVVEFLCLFFFILSTTMTLFYFRTSRELDQYKKQFGQIENN